MFLVIELQTNESGQVANIVTQHEAGNEADSKYHAILSVAAISKVPKHAAIIIDEEGNRYDSKCYDHTKVATTEDILE